MPKFNLKDYMSFQDYKKTDGDDHINRRLEREEHVFDAPETITENLLEKGRVGEPEVTIEKQLEKNRTGGSEVLIERELDIATGNFEILHRNPKAYDGNMGKVEELRRSPQTPTLEEEEVNEPASSFPKDKRWWEVKSPDGLKIAKTVKANDWDTYEPTDGYDDGAGGYDDGGGDPDLDAILDEIHNEGETDEFGQLEHDDVLQDNSIRTDEQIAHDVETKYTSMKHQPIQDGENVVWEGLIRVTDGTDPEDLTKEMRVFLSDKEGLGKDLPFTDDELDQMIHTDRLYSDNIITYTIAQPSPQLQAPQPHMASYNFPIVEASQYNFPIVEAIKKKR